MEAAKNGVLERVKMLLDIKDNEQDDLLSFIIDDVENLILGYCRIEILPRQLESLVPVIAVDIYRAKGYGAAASPERVKSISEGERSVAFAETDDEGVLSNYYKRLDPYKCRRGRVPSELG